VLLSGFWIQLGAGLVLAVGGLGLLFSTAARRRSGADAEHWSRPERSPSAGGRPRSAGAGGVS